MINTEMDLMKYHKDLKYNSAQVLEWIQHRLQKDE